MNPFRFEAKMLLEQLDKRKGGYTYLRIDAMVVDRLSQKNRTRLLCTIDQQLTIHCGLNHLGDGNFFIILGARYLKSLKKKAGDEIHFVIREDPDPLGAPMPEVLEVLLEQEPALKAQFDAFTPGKKRMVIHGILHSKDIDKQVHKATQLITGELRPGRRKQGD